MFFYCPILYMVIEIFAMIFLVGEFVIGSSRTSWCRKGK